MKNYDLQRFIKAQQKDYPAALAEIKRGRKQSHWMWYIFPQIAGLGMSATSSYYAIHNLEEARAYMDHPVLNANLIEICEALLRLDSTDAGMIFGFPDHMKLKSSMTLFACACPEMEIFQKILDKFYGGEKDAATLKILKDSASGA